MNILDFYGAIHSKFIIPENYPLQFFKPDYGLQTTL